MSSNSENEMLVQQIRYLTKLIDDAQRKDNSGCLLPGRPVGSSSSVQHRQTNLSSAARDFKHGQPFQNPTFHLNKHRFSSIKVTKPKHNNKKLVDSVEGRTERTPLQKSLTEPVSGMHKSNKFASSGAELHFNTSKYVKGKAQECKKSFTAGHTETMKNKLMETEEKIKMLKQCLHDKRKMKLVSLSCPSRGQESSDRFSKEAFTRYRDLHQTNVSNTYENFSKMSQHPVQSAKQQTTSEQKLPPKGSFISTNQEGRKALSINNSQDQESISDHFCSDDRNLLQAVGSSGISSLTRNAKSQTYPCSSHQHNPIVSSSGYQFTRGGPSPKKSSVSSVTPISDLITSNIQRMKSISAQVNSLSNKQGARVYKTDKTSTTSATDLAYMNRLPDKGNTNQQKEFHSIASKFKSSTSITPISDLITANLRKQANSDLRSNISASLLKGKSLDPSQKYHPNQTVIRKSVFQDSVEQSKTLSITPISDLIEKNLKKKTYPKCPVFDKNKKWTKSKANSITDSRSESNRHYFHLKPRNLQFVANVIKSKYKKSYNAKQSFTKSITERPLSRLQCKSQSLYTNRSLKVLKSRFKIQRKVPAHQSRKPSNVTGNNNTLFTKSRYKIQSTRVNNKHWKQDSRRSYATTYRKPDNRSAGQQGRNIMSWRKGDQSAMWKTTLQVKRLQRFRDTRSRYNLDKRGFLQKSGLLGKKGHVTGAMASVLQGQCLVMIDGRVYRTSQSQLAGNQARSQAFPYKKPAFYYSSLKSRKVSSLKKNIYLWKKIPTTSSQNLSTTKHNSSTQLLASRVLQRSIHTATSKYKKKTEQRYCMFYNRFGKCNRMEKCKFIHDPAKVAVCTRFLRGTCSVVNCPFSHKVEKEKMPVCSYFLRGVCNRDSCPYLHVKVNENAEVCKDFLKGFCPRGIECKQRHSLICPDFAARGNCSLQDRCPLKHIKQAGKQNQDVKRRKEQKKKGSHKHKLKEEADESQIPFKLQKLPVFISLEKSEDDLPKLDTKESTYNVVTEQSEKLKIKPQF